MGIVLVQTDDFDGLTHVWNPILKLRFATNSLIFLRKNVFKYGKGATLHLPSQTQQESSRIPIPYFLKHKKRIKPLKECISRRLHACGIPFSPSFQRRLVHEVCVPQWRFLARLQHPSSTLLHGILLTSSRRKLHTRKNQSDRESLR